MAPADYRRWRRILIWSILTGSTVWLLSLVSFWKLTILFSVQYHWSLSILEVLKVFLRQFLYSGIGYSKIVRLPRYMIATSPVDQP